MSLDFGSEVAGKLSDEQIVTITNTGGGNLVIADSEFIGAAPVDFGLTMDFCSFQVLAAGESCEFGFSMRATELGERVAQFVIQSNDPEQPLFFMDLRGNGTGSGGCGLSPSLPSLEYFFGWMLLLGLLWIGFRRKGTS